MTISKAGPRTAINMTQACSQLLNSLSAEQAKKITYEYLDGERIFWYYPPLNRHGLPLRDMNENQRLLAYSLMATGLSDESYQRGTQIIDLEPILGEIEKGEGKITFVRDSTLYYFTVFGKPNSQDPWGWRVEGHHISLHFSIWGDKVISMTPLFFGANPAEVRHGPRKGQRTLAVREDLALDLMDSLDANQRNKATIYEAAPYDIITFNSSRASLPMEEGLPASKMSDIQRGILENLVSEYVGQVSDELSQEKLASLQEDGLDRLYWAWGGPATRNEPHYYRIHGGNFVVEFDNRQDGANHIHSVWRDVANDFANDVLSQHLLLFHVL